MNNSQLFRFGFDGTLLIEYIGNDSNVVIPDGVIAINFDAFKNCAMLTDIKFPDSIRELRDSAFENCSNLREVKIPGSVEGIQESVFKNCTNLKNLLIADGVGYIHASAFENCSNLKTVKIPGSVRYIARDAFKGCENAIFIVEKYSFAYCMAISNNWNYKIDGEHRCIDTEIIRTCFDTGSFSFYDEDSEKKLKVKLMQDLDYFTGRFFLYELNDKQLEHMIKSRYWSRYHDKTDFLHESIRIEFSNLIKMRKLHGDSISKETLLEEIYDIETCINQTDHNPDWIKNEWLLPLKDAILDGKQPERKGINLSDVVDSVLNKKIRKLIRDIRRSQFGGNTVFGEYSFERNTITLYMRAMAESEKNPDSFDRLVESVFFHECFHAFCYNTKHFLRKTISSEYKEKVVSESLASFAEYRFYELMLGDPYKIRLSWDYCDIDNWPYAGAKVIYKSEMQNSKRLFNELFESFVIRDDVDAAYDRIFYLYRVNETFDDKLMFSLK